MRHLRGPAQGNQSDGRDREQQNGVQQQGETIHGFCFIGNRWSTAAWLTGAGRDP